MNGRIAVRDLRVVTVPVPSEAEPFRVPGTPLHLRPHGVVTLHYVRCDEAPWRFDGAHVHGSRVRADGTDSGKAATTIHVEARGSRRQPLTRYPAWVGDLVETHHPSPACDEQTLAELAR